VFDGFESLSVDDANASTPVRSEPAPTTTATAGVAGKESTSAVAAGEKGAAANIKPAAPDSKVARESRPSRWRPRLRRPNQAARWAIASGILTLVLALQGAYAFRSEISARSSAMRTAFANVCDLAGCSVTLPQRPDLVRIEASDVHMIDTNRPSLIQLTATLRSYAGYDVGYPALDLVLTNANEHALARRVFLPRDYVGPGREVRSGIPPNAEITVALDLDTGDLNAAGFRLDLLAAPAP
jgi:hypothetical protein